MHRHQAEGKAMDRQERHEKLERLVHAVFAMRAAQNRYFRTRNPQDLVEAKYLERDVDRLLNVLGDLGDQRARAERSG